MRLTIPTLAVFGSVMCLVPVALAEPIIVRVESGTAQTGSGVDSSGIEIAGTRGLSLTAGLSIGNSCLRVSCIVEAGDPIPMAIGWLGLDIRSAVLTLDGVTYTNVAGFNDPNTLTLDFSGRSPLAPAFHAGPLTVQAPFTFQGVFRHYGTDEDDDSFTAHLVGQGLASITLIGLQTSSDHGIWQTQGIRWNFTPRAVPEPAVLSLVGLGVASAWNRARRRRDTARGHRAAAEILAIR